MRHKMLFGQALVELLLALAVSSLALVVMTQVATKSLSNSGYSRNRSEGNKYAVEAIEWIRAQRGDWATFTAHTGTYCMGTLAFNACSGTNDVITGTGFTRRAVFNNSVPNQLSVDVTVTWREKNNMPSSKQSIIFKQY